MPGTALLFAAAPVGKGRLVDAASVLPPLAAVPPGTLTGTATATLVELADPVDPQTVLTRLRTAAAAPGPLALCLAGQLHLDPKQRVLHIALARTTPSTVRYTALPWPWLVSELKDRRPGTTAVVVDLVADAQAWRHLHDGQPTPGLGPGVRLYGRIAPPPPRRTIGAPDYLRACAQIWRDGHQPPLDQLHEHVAARTGPEDALFLSDAPQPTAPPPLTQPTPAQLHQPHQSHQPHQLHQSHQPPPDQLPSDPLPAIVAAAQQGRHSEAAAMAAVWESQALRTHGPGSEQAVHWMEVRADLARLAQDPALSCTLWMSVTEARLSRGQAPDAPEVESAADRAHHQWQQLDDPVRAGELAALLLSLRHRVPGRRHGALEAIRRRLEHLHATTPAAVKSQA